MFKKIDWGNIAIIMIWIWASLMFIGIIPFVSGEYPLFEKIYKTILFLSGLFGLMGLLSMNEHNDIHPAGG